jgi:hypothetical protein
MSRADSDKSMETVHLSEEPTNDYEEITVQSQPTRQSRRCQVAIVGFCLASGTAILIAIIVELVNAFKDNPYI